MRHRLTIRHHLAIQTTASLIVLSVIALAEAAALLLAHFPTSIFLWHMNLEVFKFVEVARESSPSPVNLLINQTTLYWDLGIAVIVLLVYRARWRLSAALISHACLIFVGLVTLDWVAAMWLPKTTSLDSAIAVFGQPNGAVLLLACGAALLSTISAHLTYLTGSRSIWQGQTHERNARSHRPGDDSDLRNRRRSSKLPGPE